MSIKTFKDSKFVIKDIPVGDKGIDATIEQMRKNVYKDLHFELIDVIADSIRKQCKDIQDKDEKQLCMAKAAYKYVVDNIKYKLDEKICELDEKTNHLDCASTELLLSPRHAFLNGYGDCDCMSMALGALFINLGMPARFRVIAWNPKTKNDFTHVYSEVGLFLKIDGKRQPVWIPADAVIPDKTFGHEKNETFRAKSYRV
jgi:hypothetical protein